MPDASEVDLSSYFLRDDPGLSQAIEERNWTLLFKAIEETAPEFIASLRGRPFKKLTAFVDRYKEISLYPFGGFVCETRMNPRPLMDLAVLLCFSDYEKPSNLWPPSTAFWEPELQYQLLDLSVVMKDWADNFRDLQGRPHWRLVDAGLQTMRAWLEDPETLEINRWFGSVEIHHRSLAFQPLPIAVSISYWNPLGETEEKFTQRIKGITAQIKKWARDQIPEMKKNLIEFDSKRNPEHFDWTALRLIRKLTYPQIIEEWAKRKPDRVILTKAQFGKA